jgi:phage/plasmid-like protein (TIGR03299 family)
VSKESPEWLNRNVLIGFTAERGTAWHYRATAQGAEPNHYPGPIPIADIQRRLFGWRAIPGRVLTHTDLHGLRPCPDRMAVVADDTGEDLGVHMQGYEIHQFPDWLLEKVQTLLDGGLSAGSAGLLKQRRQAWVSVEVPDTVATPEGVQFRPHLLACTSHDGSLATTYKRTVTNVVCDNTMGEALRGAGQVIKIRHKKNSRQGRLEVLSARQALDMVQILADDFAAEVRDLCQITVTEAQWQDFLLAHAPDTGTQRSRTLASNRRTKLGELWQFDNRVAPWRGTAWGVLQAVNTYDHHHATVRGASRPERNLTRAVTDHANTLDSTTLALLDQVLAAA